LTRMLVSILYIAATVGVTVYMLVALLRPEDF
jgi:K+-transporting ATPase KdpF subunit